MDGEWNRVQREIELDAWLRRFAAEEVDATYHACDVSDGAALAGVLENIRRTSGPIEGIIHGAGIERAASYERKTRDNVLETIAAKVDGALHLMRLTWNDPVRWFIGFGSVSGRLGSNGQTDYCLASDTLCKLAGWYKQRRREFTRSRSTGTPGPKSAWLPGLKQRPCCGSPMGPPTCRNAKGSTT